MGLIPRKSEWVENLKNSKKTFYLEFVPDFISTVSIGLNQSAVACTSICPSKVCKMLTHSQFVHKGWIQEAERAMVAPVA